MAQKGYLAKVLKDLQKFNNLEKEKGQENGNKDSKVTTAKPEVTYELGKVWCLWTQGAYRQEWQEALPDIMRGLAHLNLGGEGRLV